MNTVIEQKILQKLSDISKLLAAQGNYSVATEEVRFKQMEMAIQEMRNIASLLETNNSYMLEISKALGIEMEKTI